MTPLISEGKVYRVLAPLYMIQEGKNKKYFYTDNELAEYQKMHKTGHLLRMKGLGAMEDDDTYATLLDDSTRRLQCLTTNDIEKAIEKFNILMGKDLASRRELAQSIDYTLEEGELL